MNFHLFLPILIPFATAIVSLLLWNRTWMQRAINIFGAAGLLASALALLASVWRDGIQAVQVGSWPAPYGITLVADVLSAVMVVVTGMMGLSVAVYSLGSMDSERESFGYYPLLHILLMGICGAFLTGDIFNLYVWFEVMLMASFVLLELGGEKAQLEGAIKYVTLNLVSSVFFLAGVAILYGLAGTLNMADLAVRLKSQETPGMVTTTAMFFLLAFGIKSAVFPLFFWLPASYHTPPAAVSAIFAGLLTKVGAYSLMRVFTLLFVHDVPFTHGLILAVSGLTMITGILGALAQNEWRRILSFNLISHIGYIVMGLGLFTPLALTGSIFYMLHDIIVITALFLVSGIACHLRGTYRLRDLGGLYKSHPSLALVFIVPALSLAGIPPFSGLWGKLILVKAGLEAHRYLIVAAALAAALLTLLSMAIIWSDAFWRSTDPRQDAQDHPAPERIPLRSWILIMSPAVVLALLTTLLGIIPEPVFLLSQRASEQLLDPSGYIRAVMEGMP